MNLTIKDYWNKSLMLCVIFLTFFSCSKDSQILNLEEEQNIEEAQEQQEEKPNTSSFTFDEPQVAGNTFYLDPVNGSINGDGSEADP